MSLVMLGELVSLGYRDAKTKRRRVMRWSGRDAPIVAYDPKARPLALVFKLDVVGASSPKARKEYARTHWGQAGDDERLEGNVLAGKAERLGPALEITYATRKGDDGELVNYWHTFGDFGDVRPWRFLPPIVMAGAGMVRLDGGTYRVSSHGIVG